MVRLSRDCLIDFRYSKVFRQKNNRKWYSAIMRFIILCI